MPTSRRRWRRPVAAAAAAECVGNMTKSRRWRFKKHLLWQRQRSVDNPPPSNVDWAAAEADSSSSSRGSRHSPSSLFVGSSLARIAPLSFCFVAVAVAVLVVILLHSSFRFEFFWLCVRLHQFALHLTVSCKCFIRFKEASSAYLQNCVG